MAESGTSRRNPLGDESLRFRWESWRRSTNTLGSVYSYSHYKYIHTSVTTLRKVFRIYWVSELTNAMEKVTLQKKDAGYLFFILFFDLLDWDG